MKSRPLRMAEVIGSPVAQKQRFSVFIQRSCNLCGAASLEPPTRERVELRSFSMRYAIAAALVASTMIATPAFAQDTDPTFTGFRGGVIGGYDIIRPGSTE